MPVAVARMLPVDEYTFRVNPPDAGHWVNDTFGVLNPCITISMIEPIAFVVTLNLNVWDPDKYEQGF